MKILLINGSPKGAKSNSIRLARSFVAGVRDHESERNREVEVEELHLSTLRIAPCKGCFACWKQTPGTCCMEDDMQTVIEGLLAANLVIWSFPLYYYSVPGPLKTLIDRQLPMSLPFMCESRDGNGSGGHPSRYDRSGIRHVLISTCGFYSAEGNYDSVTRMFDHVLGQGKYTSIFCGQGELFRVKELSARTDTYLAAVRQAGREYAAGTIREETEAKLKALLYPREVFEKMADASWGISKDSGEKEEESLIFTRQMAALYNRECFDGRERVLEICYTDLGKTYRIKLGKDGAEVLTDESLRATTRIDTPFSVWLALSRGEMRGDEALAKHLYTVSGDFSLMMNWDRYFGTEEQAENTRPVVKLTTEKKPPSMQNMLLAWIALWVAVSVEPRIGALITLGVCSFLPLVTERYELCRYDRLSFALVAGLAVYAAVTGNGLQAVCAGYLAFGCLWLGSCFTKEPLCAAYVKYRYGKDALQNPIFMRTNYILAAAWGLVYVVIAIVSYFLSGKVPALVLSIAVQAIPILMGLFTAWFQNWYPARVAAGK
jgi:hypothetical protein